MNGRNNFDDLLKQMGAGSPNELENAAKSGRLGDLLKGVDKEKLSQVERILQNKEETERILNSPQAQALMKRLKKKNGDDLSG